MGNAYLEGNYGPVSKEVTVGDLEVTGTIPEELTGRYLRNGPNPVTAPDPDAYHWFIGDGMVHGLRLDGGRASWYRNRWVRSDKVADALGEPHRDGAPHTQMDSAPNTNVIGHAGRTFAIVEAGSRPYELTNDLETVGACDFGGTLEAGYTAHPKRDPRTGELHAVSYWWGWGNKVEYTIIDADARVRESRFIETHGSPMLHDMSLTERYAVVYDLPVAFDVDAAMGGATFPYFWSDDYPARIGLVPRAGGDVQWIEVDPCYVFHPMNAYDDGDDLVIDLVHWNRMFDDRSEHHGPWGNKASLRRWTVETGAGKVREELRDDRTQEFPRVDERLVGQRHRFGYSAVELDADPAAVRGGILKHDMDNGTSEVLDLGVGSGQNEAVFVPRSADAAEDDGWLLCLTYDAAADRSKLDIHHAQDLAGGPVATVQLPVRVPFGFHGNWVADA